MSAKASVRNHLRSRGARRLVIQAFKIQGATMKKQNARIGSGEGRPFGLGLLVVAACLAIMPVGSARADDDDRDRDGDRGGERAYAIGLWGDLPYSDLQAQVGVPNLIADMNAQKLAFTVHDGDLKAGNGTPGSATPTNRADGLYVHSHGRFNT